MRLKLTKKEYDLLSVTLNGPVGVWFPSENYFLDNYGVSEVQLEDMNLMLKKYTTKIVDDEIVLDLDQKTFLEIVACFKASKLYLDPINYPLLQVMIGRMLKI